MKTLAIVLLAACAVAEAADLPKAETLFEKYVTVTGGMAAYAQRRTEVAKGTVQMAASGVTGTAEIYSAAPNSQVIIMEVQGVGRIEQGTDGVHAWELSEVAGPRLKEGAERIEALREALFNLPANWRKLYAKVDTVAAETTEGIECYKVLATTTNGGKVETWWFDRKTGYTVKNRRTAITGMGEIPAELIFKDFKKTGTVIQPLTLLQRAGGQEVVIRLVTVNPNAAIPASRFAPPAEIRQLMPVPQTRKKAA